MKNLTRKKGRYFENTVTNAKEVAQLTETLQQKVQAKAQRYTRYEKRETHYIQNKMFKDDTKKILQKLRHKEYRCQRTPLYGRSTALLEVTVGRKSTE
jgi:hypothetical protein